MTWKRGGRELMNPNSRNIAAPSVARTNRARRLFFRIALGVLPRIFSLAFLLGAPWLAEAQLHGAPSFSAELSETGLRLEGVTPGGEVAIFGVWRERHVYWSEVGRVDERVADDDGDGEIEWDLGKPVPQATVLFAVDITSGQWANQAPQSFGLRALSQERWAMSPDGSSLRADAKRLHLLWIRPGNDAWSGAALDGGLGDSSASSDGQVEVPIAEIPAIGGQDSLTSPEELQSGDILIAVDSASLRFLIHEVAGGAV